VFRHTGEDYALEQALQDADGAEYLPSAPGDAPRGHQTEDGSATAGHKEDHFGAIATAQEAPGTKGQDVAPVETGEYVGLLFLRPLVFLRD